MIRPKAFWVATVPVTMSPIREIPLVFQCWELGSKRWVSASCCARSTSSRSTSFAPSRRRPTPGGPCRFVAEQDRLRAAYAKSYNSREFSVTYSPDNGVPVFGSTVDLIHFPEEGRVLVPARPAWPVLVPPPSDRSDREIERDRRVGFNQPTFRLVEGALEPRSPACRDRHDLEKLISGEEGDSRRPQLTRRSAHGPLGWCQARAFRGCS